VIDIISWPGLRRVAPIKYHAMQFSGHLSSHPALNIAPHLDSHLAGKGR